MQLTENQKHKSMYFYTMTKTVQIGQAIEARIKELGMVKRRVAEEMAMSPQNLNSIFRSATIRTDLLEKFSRLLDMNFFLLYRGLNENEDSQPVIQLPENHHEICSCNRRF